MATPRKNWSKQPDQILSMGWPDSVVADFTRLQAFLNTRWARHGLTAEEAGEAVLTRQEMMLVTNVQNPQSARRRLLALPSDTPQGRFEAHEVHTGRVRGVKIRWSNFAEFQGYFDRPHPNAGPPPGKHFPTDAPSEKRREEKRKEEEEREKKAADASSSHSLSLISLVMKTRPDWSEPQADAWLLANLPQIEEEVDAKGGYANRDAAIRGRTITFARNEKVAPPSKPAKVAEPVFEDNEPEQRRIARKRLAARGHHDPSEAQIRDEFEQFEEHLGPYMPPPDSDAKDRKTA